MHIPVLCDAVLEFLDVRPDGTYLDATAGLCGHTAVIAQRLDTGIVVANDRDSESLAIGKENVARWSDRVRYQVGKFSQLPLALLKLGIAKVDGLLADLGASRYQLTDSERGFSFSAEGPLDMRMDRTGGLTAAEIINTGAEKALADLFYMYGQERRARRIARAIVRARPIQSTLQLARVVEQVAPRTGRLHPATRIFMALRIAVNDEQGELDRLLESAPNMIQSGGRMVVISFMSLEDRKVKLRFQSLARQGRARLLTKHVVRPTEGEVQSNPASRSAKLRALEMT